MTAQAGRDAVLNKNSVALAGMRVLGFTSNSEPIDITDGDDSGLRTLHSKAGTESLDIPFEGVWKDDTLRALALSSNSKLFTDISMDFAEGGDLAGDFYLNNYSETGNHDGEITFTANFISSGAWTYTPAP